MAFIAFHLGLLTRAQANRREWEKTTVSVFMENAGMYGDILIVSPVSAWILANFLQHWKVNHVAIAVAISTALSGFMINLWSKESLDTEDPFGKDGRVNIVGWLHYIYMIPCVASILLFYFGTLGVSTRSATWVTIALAFHIAVGFIQPEYATWKKITIGRIRQVLIVWFLLFLGWLYVTNHP